MTDGLSLSTMSNRMSYAIREKVGKRAQEQRRSLMYLVAEFLQQQGLYKSYEALTEEAHLTNSYEVCDNVDLEIIFNEYVDYYHARFNKLPQICKRVANQGPAKDGSESSSAKDSVKKKQKPMHLECEESPNELSLLVTPLANKNSIPIESQPGEANVGFADEKVLRPLGTLYPTGSEWREIAEIVTREIVMTDLNVHWDDIHGLEECKEILKEAVVFPTKYPFLFNKIFTPWRGILIYGPPGTGKTMLAKAVATECNLTFFNITASSLVSKWRGDSEKYIRVLFELANHHAPSVIFIDEIDWIAAGDGANRSDNSEPARRFRADLLSRLDGLLSQDNSRVLLLAATNAPWNLDSALLRRLEKHVKVEVPNYYARRDIVKDFTAEHLHKTYEFDHMIHQTEGFSSADLKRLCKEAWILQMRPIWKKLERERCARSVNDPTAKATLIKDCEFLVTAKDKILLTANHFTQRYEEWKKTMTTQG